MTSQLCEVECTAVANLLRSCCSFVGFCSGLQIPFSTPSKNNFDTDGELTRWILTSAAQIIRSHLFVPHLVCIIILFPPRNFSSRADAADVYIS
ncbi:hypothetical protein COP2_047058 [Malus domestica]